ncbi:hypothetical protein CPB83DRAFT_859754 [Crepidotus variabilis]|uniref:SnoaL-like domain-containing protein n=1 Tax=Crepidotus variabilis TaxID=179855 RepID=A0A9P6EA15_9AGAR|nr:hypothetical protein CPB83DRAFT_859754 [Crepidotus variabilis]
MSVTQQTQQILSSFLEHTRKSDVDALNQLAAPDATWWFNGAIDKVPIAGKRKFSERVVELHHGFFGQMHSMKINVLDTVVQGEIGMAEFEVTAEGPGKHQSYANNAVVKLTVKDGKIREVREYVDFFGVLKYLESAKSEPEKETVPLVA